MVTIREVAVEAQCSVATVSRALNGGQVSSAALRRVTEAVDRLGYTPNETARDLVGGRTSTLAVLVPDITNPFFPELVASIQEVAEEHGHMVLLVQDEDDPAKHETAITALRRRQVSGLIVVGGTREEQESTLLSGVPHVLVDRGHGGVHSISVRSDNRAGGRIAAEHLISYGHEDIAWIGGPAELANSQERQAGMHDALRTAGLDPRPDLECAGDFLEGSGYEAVMKLRARRRRFTAVMAANDLMAIGAMRALDDLGLRVPEDVSVVGFDDIHLASYVRPSLTTVRQHTSEMGRYAARLLLEAAPTDGGSPQERDHLVEVDLVPRRSSGPVRATPPGGDR